MQLIADKIEERLDHLLEEKNLYLVDIKTAPGNKIQVFVDGDKNVTIDECAQISRQLEAYLDEDPTVPSNYNLEVSSPGMSNPLKLPRQYKKRIGRILKITRQDGSQLLAELLNADETKVEVQEMKSKKSNSKYKKPEYTKGDLITLTYSEIKKTIVQFNF